jgi:plastocyanin
MKPVMAGLSVALLLLAGCGSGGATGEAASIDKPGPGAPASVVTIAGVMFEPSQLSVATGTTVKWTNEDDIPHTVTSGKPKRQGIPGISEDRPGRPDGTFRESFGGAGSQYEFTFEEAGAYNYFCEIHANMTGTIVVE